MFVLFISRHVTGDYRLSEACRPFVMIGLFMTTEGSLLTAECIWFKCDLYLRFIPPINIGNIWNDLRPFLKCKEGPFSRSWRSPRSNSLEIQNDENSKSKLAKTR